MHHVCQALSLSTNSRRLSWHGKVVRMVLLNIDMVHPFDSWYGESINVSDICQEDTDRAFEVMTNLNKSVIIFVFHSFDFVP